MDDDLDRRIKRLYAAVGEIERQDLTAFPPQVVKSGSVTAWFQDFTGGLSEPQLENLAILAVQSVAHLRDPLRRWARQNGKNPQDVAATIKQSDPLRLVVDLAEHAKHGGQRRDGGCSGKSPHLGTRGAFLSAYRSPQVAGGASVWAPGRHPDPQRDG